MDSNMEPQHYFINDRGLDIEVKLGRLPMLKYTIYIDVRCFYVTDILR